jgi:hypothetical protein
MTTQCPAARRLLNGLRAAPSGSSERYAVWKAWQEHPAECAVCGVGGVGNVVTAGDVGRPIVDLLNGENKEIVKDAQSKIY